jgi:hypothetical protein
MGQKQKLPRLNGMSCPPPKADIRRKDRHVRFVPEAVVSTGVLLPYNSHPHELAE